ncbi:MAG TPA: ABC transporter ATP-binding protein, partial [Oscillospiraceae bacterium]|nr:ABC transporter ATP-binding protein [Oscillospiraceae bacterium]
MEKVLITDNFAVKYDSGFYLQPLNIVLNKGEIAAVVGESGSGKTTLAKALLKLPASQASCEGEVVINGVNIYQLSAAELLARRSVEFAICLQNSSELLNPLLTIREQLYEVLRKAVPEAELELKATWLLAQLELTPEVLEQYPRQLSGGMLQKVLIICAVALSPSLVILDEPTSSLDERAKSRVLDLINMLRQRYQTTFLIVTHDLSVAKAISQRMFVLYQGKLVETGLTTSLLNKPKHPYTRGLIDSSIEINPYRDLWGIRQVAAAESEKSGCPFYPRCTQRLPHCAQQQPDLAPHHSEPERLIACNRGGVITVLAGKMIT